MVAVAEGAVITEEYPTSLRPGPDLVKATPVKGVLMNGVFHPDWLIYLVEMKFYRCAPAPQDESLAVKGLAMSLNSSYSFAIANLDALKDRFPCQANR